MPSETKQEPAKNSENAAATPEKKPKRVPARKAKPTRPSKRKPVKPAKAKTPRAASAKPAPKPHRKHSTKAERAKILAAAEGEGLTALQVQKRFGVKPVTYYSWRKATKKAGAKAQPALRATLGGIDITSQVQLLVRAQIAEMLPGIVEGEVAAALGGAEVRRRGRSR